MTENSDFNEPPFDETPEQLVDLLVQCRTTMLQLAKAIGVEDPFSDIEYALDSFTESASIPAFVNAVADLVKAKQTKPILVSGVGGVPAALQRLNGVMDAINELTDHHDYSPVIIVDDQTALSQSVYPIIKQPLFCASFAYSGMGKPKHASYRAIPVPKKIGSPKGKR